MLFFVTILSHFKHFVSSCDRVFVSGFLSLGVSSTGDVSMSLGLSSTVSIFHITSCGISIGLSTGSDTSITSSFLLSLSSICTTVCLFVPLLLYLIEKKYFLNKKLWIRIHYIKQNTKRPI
jgi:hypothetical protein